MTVATLLKHGTLNKADQFGTYVALQGTDTGGQIMATPREPGLTVVDYFPKPGGTIDQVLWVENNGLTLYGLGRDKGVYKSTDGGGTWTLQGNPLASMGNNGTFLKLANGNLLTGVGGTPETIWLSTNDGVTWSSVLSMRTNCILLGVQSWCEDLTTGYVYLGEYDGTNSGIETTVNIYRSTDHGATWSIFYSFPGQGNPITGFIRHIHSVQYDSVSQRVYILTGDTEAASGIYRVDGTGTTVEKVVLNSETADTVSGARAVSLMFFPNTLAWIADDPDVGLAWFTTLPRTSIGSASPAVVAKVYLANSSGFFSVQAASDGSAWIASASNEAGGGQLDANVHLYYVTNNGATIFELGSVGSDATIAAIAPLGQANIHGSTFWLKSHNVSASSDGSVRNFTYKCRISRGARTQIPPDYRRAKIRQPMTINSGLVTVAAGVFQRFFIANCGANAATLYIYDIGAYVESGSGGLRVRVTDNTGTVVASLDTSTGSLRASQRKDSAEYLAAISAAANSQYFFKIQESGGVNPATGQAYVTFGWDR